MAKRSGNKIPKIFVRKRSLPAQKVCMTYRPGKTEGPLEDGLIAIATAMENGSLRKDVAQKLIRDLKDYRGGSC